MNRCGCSSSASTTATGRSTWDRPASSSGQLAPGRVHDVAVAQQHQRVDALLLHGVPQPRAAFAVHPGAVGQLGDVEQRRSRTAMVDGHEIPRNFLMLVLTILTAFSGPTASTTDASDFSE